VAPLLLLLLLFLCIIPAAEACTVRLAVLRCV
jgi:hypothetical protein